MKRLNDKQAELMTAFLKKWAQGEDTGFLKPTCHIDDVFELVEKIINVKDYA